MKLNLKTQFVSFTYKLHCSLEVATSCILTHTFKFPSLKNEQVAVLDSTRQTVLGDSPWYWILFIGREQVSTTSTGQTATCIIYCKVQQPPCDTSAEEVCSFGKRASATSFFSCKEFLEVRCEVKPESHLQVTCGGGQRAGQYTILTQANCLLAV